MNSLFHGKQVSAHLWHGNYCACDGCVAEAADSDVSLCARKTAASPVPIIQLVTYEQRTHCSLKLYRPTNIQKYQIRA